MAISKVSVGVVAFATLFLAIVLPAAHAQDQSFAPAPSPTSDGASIDQGIAYVLMLVALVLTYLIHASDLCHF
ncbi:arabinogalactan peptide 20-like [Tripterygium wilfordii]|uniref:Arabinogalactan peptide 20-like n=1 Tax=Tripterygium wilfordii TaxID=458696 RepID=A0A7J7C8H9_TRIWF|nr:arabinogalactan protein 41-like [Tripterygium wilfordii]KAF5730056.1 arabinogalactan peptide 20-like [Tripterygium wilfordii]